MLASQRLNQARQNACHIGADLLAEVRVHGHNLASNVKRVTIDLAAARAPHTMNQGYESGYKLNFGCKPIQTETSQSTQYELQVSVCQNTMVTI
jgi:hypothetical protein